MKEEIENFFRGEILDDDVTLEKYSRDTSLFQVRPKLVVFPNDSEDLKKLVAWINLHPEESLTMRSAGSDMTGGPLNESIVADLTKHINQLGTIEETSVITKPGVFYRDFEKKTLAKGLILPCYPASKSLCALGGMISNNCGGERSLRYGKMENFVLETKVIFTDGNEYSVKPLNKNELEYKIAQNDFEGFLYKNLYRLISDNRKIIEEAKPAVSKNSAGYYLWNVIEKNQDGEEIFDLNKLIVGSQGTLGIVTEAKIRLIPEKTHHDMVALFFKSWDELPHVVEAIMSYDPESLETFDADTLKLGIRFMPEIAKKSGSNLLSFVFKFIPEALIGLEMFGLPKLIVLVEISEDSESEVKEKVKKVIEAIKPFKVWHRIIEKDSEEDKFWIMRRESFNLLRKHVGDKKTAPFVEDFCVPVEKMPVFLPKALKILKSNGIKANIAGHAGNGNYHIIPLMDLRKESERAKITQVASQFYDLVGEYDGSITGEHNDGIMRTPYLEKMYSQDVLKLFQKTKEIFDPKNIFNPGKKVSIIDSTKKGGSIEYLEKHIAIG